MLSSSSPEFSHKSLKIKQDDKFISKLLSKETSLANPSFRVYYGNVSSAVPFTWEIQPGTPKHKFSDNSIPPLTPPPSYYNISTHNKPSKRKFYTRSKLVYKLLLHINPIKKGQVASSSSPSSLSSSSWSSSMSSNVPSSRRRRFMSCGSSFNDGRLNDGHMYGGGSPDSVMCFGVNKNSKCSDVDSNNGGGTGYMVVIMKKAFLSIVGRRSG